MKYKDTCHCCGHSITAYSHHINKPLVEALRQLVDHYEDRGIACNLQNHLRLTKNQYNNFQKLQHFDVVRRTENGWYPTTKGIKFIYGDCQVWNKVSSMGNETLSHNHECWDNIKTKPELIFVQDIDETSYKQRKEYQADKVGNQTLF